MKTLSSIKDYKRLDYVTLWIYKSAKFIFSNKISSCSLVSTNSICQLINKFILLVILKDFDINFGVKSFPWGNNAKNNAVVTCVILGLGLKNTK